MSTARGVRAPGQHSKVAIAGARVAELHALVAREGFDRAVLMLRSSPTTVTKALAGFPVMPGTAVRLEGRIAKLAASAGVTVALT